MNEQVDKRRVFIFIAFTFGIAWAVSLVVYLAGGYFNSPEIVPGVSLATVLIAGLIMPAPALAHVLTRLVTREGWRDTYLRPKIKRGWRYWLIAWLGTAVLVIVGIMFFYLVLPRYYDPALRPLLELMPPGLAITPWLYVVVGTVQGVLLSPLLNGLFTLGEEFGWRAYLQPKLMPLGGRKAMLLMGVIWGVWHWPVILMGHNYGLDYPGAPILGPLAMVWFTLLLGTFLGWLTLKAGSVWPAVIGHAVINGLAQLPAFFTQGEPNPLLGPGPVGVIGGIGFALIALWIFLKLDAPVGPARQSA